MQDINNDINKKFMKSVCDGDLIKIKLLLDKGFDIHKYNDLALCLAIRNGQHEVIEYLKQKIEEKNHISNEHELQIDKEFNYCQFCGKKLSKKLIKE